MQKKFVVESHELDDNQMELLNNDCNAIVIAGAGSGKTLTILGKIYFLIEKMYIAPKDILLISFTNASVDDLKRRVKYPVDIFTFHKLAIHILKLNCVNYSLAPSNLLNYTIKEYLITCKKEEQKYILKFLRLNLEYSKFISSIYFEQFVNFIETFINLYKTNNYNFNDILLKRYKKTERKILLIIFKIYYNYELEKQSTKTFDFDDLIVYASKYVNSSKLNYKYIIVDEFQDTSFIRLQLVKQIFNNTQSKIIVVGDDWQSIYHFSGCDLKIFLEFSKLFPDVKAIKLKNTYRNSQELLNIAKQFVEKNPKQIKKELCSTIKNSSPIILCPYKNKKEKFLKLLSFVLEESEDIMILSRNNKDIFDYLSDDLKFENGFVIYKDYKIKYMTVHKSKGLEAQNVIILNCDNSLMGFPSKIQNNSILKKSFFEENFPYAEERRLFYVAITRCKNRVFIMYNESNPSVFIKEIKKLLKTNNIFNSLTNHSGVPDRN